MAATLKMFAFLLVCCLCNGGNSYEQCKPNDLAVTQIVMARRDGGYLEFAVTVENRCACRQGDVRLACRGFKSSVRVYPAAILQPAGSGLCTLNSGYPIGTAVKFYYGSPARISFARVSSTTACSAVQSLYKW